MPNPIVVSVLTGVLGACVLHAQAITEYGATTAGASAAGTVTAKAVVNIFGKASKALADAAQSGEDVRPSPSPVQRPASGAKHTSQAKSTATPLVSVVAPVAPEPLAKPGPQIPPNLSALETGMGRADMLKNVGKPSMSMSSMESSALVETCWYKNGDDSVTVTLRDGKVSAFDKFAAPKP
jgi:hypothetical protein